MTWRGHLALHYSRDGDRTVALDRHSGPLRVLQRLYPEGPAVCHHVLVHPPGGIVGGDVLELQARLDSHTHAVITTPGATRFYRSAWELALQQTRLALASGARLEWLPLETIAYSGCIAENHLQLQLAPGAEAMGWDVLALGLPAADAAFARGIYRHHLELPGVWLDRGEIDAQDQALLNSPLGFAGKRVLATLWWATGTPMPDDKRQALLDAAREQISADALQATAGTSSPQPQVLVLRALAERVEPAMALLAQVRYDAFSLRERPKLPPHLPN